MKPHFLFDVVVTPIGPLTAVIDAAGAVTELWTYDCEERLLAKGAYTRDSAALEGVNRQLQEYVDGERRSFDLTIEPKGSEFQLRVWRQLLKVPYGETRSYGQLAAILGHPNSSRAVGRANGTNPISIIIPCHRVIGADGALTGYGGGLPMKRRLLELEGVHLPSKSKTTRTA